jgi:hypothetical protein
VPTATFSVLFVFLVLDNERRKVVHCNVTESPTAAWTGHYMGTDLSYPFWTATTSRWRVASACANVLRKHGFPHSPRTGSESSGPRPGHCRNRSWPV